MQRCSADRTGLIQAAAVAAQVAPDGREVAVGRRVGDVVASARGGMKTEMTLFFCLFFSFGLSDYICLL